MSLKAKSAFNYGLSVTQSNRYIDFKISPFGDEITATLRIGHYSLSSLCEEISRAMKEVETTGNYICSVDRSIGAGMQNRFSILTSLPYLSILFLTGTNSSYSIKDLIGFLNQDYTGQTSYIGSFSCGTILVPDYVGYNYLSQDCMKEVQGTYSVSVSGVKESIVYSVMEFLQVEFKYENYLKLPSWAMFFQWAIQQRVFEFIPEITNTSVYYECTLEKSSSGKALDYKMTEMLPSFPDHYTTGINKFRKTTIAQTFI